jgi:hypothetical protein
MMKETLKIAGRLGCAMLCAASLCAQELIVNGSFENSDRTFVPDANKIMSLLPGSTKIPGWTTTNAERLGQQ